MHEPSKYANKARHVALLRPRESAFADAVAAFVRSIDLSVVEVLETDLGDLGVGALEVQRAAESCGAAIMVLEGRVIQEDLSGARQDRTAQPSAWSVSLYAQAAHCFNGDRLVVVKQRDDPVRWDLDAREPCELDNSRDAAKRLVAQLRTASVLIETRLAQRPGAHDFDFPAGWWRRDFEGEDGTMPSFTEFLVDSMFNRSVTQTKLQDEAREQIQAREPLDLKYHYVGWRAAKAWSDLTTDGNYAHGPHIKHIVKRAATILSRIDTTGKFNYVSLGPGNGDTDAEVLTAIGRGLEIRSLFLVDVSIELLQIAADEIIKRVLEKHVLTSSPRVRAMLADFEDNLSKLAPILDVEGVRNLFTLLGFTIGNGTELKIMRSLAQGTKPGDYVLLDARLHAHGELPDKFVMSEEERQALVEPYDTQALEAFAFAPVEEASDYVVRSTDESISIQLTPHWGDEYVSVVPSAINVYVECTGLYQNEMFRKRMRMVRRPRETNEVLRLATLTFYNLDSLTDWIEQFGGFQVLWSEKLNGSALILLERLGDRP
jgi:hypothetical protein